MLPNFIVKKLKKTPKSGKFRPCEVYVTALIYKNEELGWRISPIIQIFQKSIFKRWRIVIK